MILSIDVGIKNLEMCLIDPETKHIEQWDVSGVPPQHEDGLFICMRDHLDAKPWVLNASTVIIEKQPDKNRKMKTVENFLHTYFIIKNPTCTCIIYDARFKIPDVAGAGKKKYAERKKTSIARCKDFIYSDNVNVDWRETFDKSKKKDDLADTVMQALSYINRRVVEPKKKTKTKSKLSARKPNQNQEETKYSKSNLAWMVKNKPRGQLEKSKRFMKDLKRYFKDFDELLGNL